MNLQHERIAALCDSLNLPEHYRQTRPCKSTTVRSKIPYFSRTFPQKQKKA